MFRWNKTASLEIEVGHRIVKLIANTLPLMGARKIAFKIGFACKPATQVAALKAVLPGKKRP